MTPRVEKHLTARDAVREIAIKTPNELVKPFRTSKKQSHKALREHVKELSRK